ncbi:MAG: penicillin-binding protein 2 [Bacteroidota bacterium]
MSAFSTNDGSTLRLRVFAGTVLLLFGLLGARLVQMQILDQSQYTDEAEDNAIEQKLVLPARGYVYDRNGELLVDNVTTYDLTVTPRRFETEHLPDLARLLGVSDSLMQVRYDRVVQYSRYKESVLMENIPFGAFVRLRENQYRIPGIGFELRQQRRYHGEAELSHALGYVREISEDQLEAMRAEGYRQGDKVGIAGIESHYENVLRGRVGREFVLVNTHGMEVARYKDGEDDLNPQAGWELHLSIDARVQALAESLFVGKRGGAVAISPKTGELIAMVSAPDYDLDRWRGRLSQDFVDYVYRNPDRPLFNRATQSFQPPGSTWKPFMSLVALEEGMITRDTRLFCGGGYLLGGRFFKCLGGTHGPIGVERAIQVSCNTFFYRLMNDEINGKRMDLTTWSTWANRFGFGTRAPIDFPDQHPGLIPDSSYFDELFPRGWGPGFTINLGIGQGNMGTTPLQLARYTAAIANGGELPWPHLLKHQVNATVGDTLRPRWESDPLPVSPDNVDIIRRGMELVVESGTARIAQIDSFSVAGKTGTAQNPRGDDHSVFIGYAPVDDPEIAVGILVENAGYGSTAAAPIASLMMEQYLKGRVDRIGLIQVVMNRRSGRDRG